MSAAKATTSGAPLPADDAVSMVTSVNCNTEDWTDISSDASSSESPRVAAQAPKKPPQHSALNDSWLFLEGVSSHIALPVDAARAYVAAVQPVALPSNWLKLLAFVVFWLVCLGWHHLQRHAQLSWHVPGEPGQTVNLARPRAGEVQVAINAVCVVLLSAYALAAYFLHHHILSRVLARLFIQRTWAAQQVVTFIMFGIAFVSSFHLTENWVAAAAGLFLFFGYAVCGRTVQASVSQRSQIGLGPSHADEDSGASFHVHGANLEAGGPHERFVQAALLGGDAGGEGLRFATLQPEKSTRGDDAVLLEQAADGLSYAYRAPCGRAMIHRGDCLIVLILTFGIRLPSFVLGGGGYNQCAGIVELLVSLVYIPVGYTCFAMFGFRAGLANRWSMSVVLVMCIFPFINLVLGGKGCATLTELIGGVYLPQVWDPEATEVMFTRGFASCSESAFAIGGETLLVASTTIAAWVHIMSNFSFLFGFVSGLCRSRCAADIVLVK